MTLANLKLTAAKKPTTTKNHLSQFTKFHPTLWCEMLKYQSYHNLKCQFDAIVQILTRSVCETLASPHPVAVHKVVYCVELS